MSTLGVLTADVSRKLGDQTVGEYYSEAEIKQAISDAYRFYVMKMIRAADGYFETTTDLSLVADTEAISISSLSPLYFKGSQLWRKVTVGHVPLKKDENRYNLNPNLGIGTGDAYIPTYNYRGSNIILIPNPIASETDGLKFDYVYVPTFPTSASLDSFEFDADFPTMYEENVKIRASIKLMETKDAIGGVSDITTFRGELIEYDQAFNDIFTKDEAVDEVAYVGYQY